MAIGVRVKNSFDWTDRWTWKWISQPLQGGSLNKAWVEWVFAMNMNMYSIGSVTPNECKGSYQNITGSTLQIRMPFPKPVKIPNDPVIWPTAELVCTHEASVGIG